MGNDDDDDDDGGGGGSGGGDDDDDDNDDDGDGGDDDGDDNDDDDDDGDDDNDDYDDNDGGGGGDGCDYSQLSPYRHPAITDTPLIQTAVTSQANINYRRLTEINSRYYGLSLMRTLTRGPYSVHCKGM